jgi:hypothetical protein
MERGELRKDEKPELLSCPPKLAGLGRDFPMAGLLRAALRLVNFWMELHARASEMRDSQS